MNMLSKIIPIIWIITGYAFIFFGIVNNIVWADELGSVLVLTGFIYLIISFIIWLIKKLAAGNHKRNADNPSEKLIKDRRSPEEIKAEINVCIFFVVLFGFGALTVGPIMVLGAINDGYLYPAIMISVIVLSLVVIPTVRLIVLLKRKKKQTAYAEATGSKDVDKIVLRKKDITRSARRKAIVPLIFLILSGWVGLVSLLTCIYTMETVLLLVVLLSCSIDFICYIFVRDALNVIKGNFNIVVDYVKNKSKFEDFGEGPDAYSLEFRGGGSYPVSLFLFFNTSVGDAFYVVKLPYKKNKVLLCYAKEKYQLGDDIVQYLKK